MQLMTTSEVAEYLRLKERTVYEMAAKRQIPVTRATGKLLFSRRQIDRWVEGHTELPNAHVAAPPPIYAGSSDPLLEWALRESGSGLAVLASGSRDGLARLARGEAVLAGVHIYEPETGDYNTTTVRREVPFPDVVVIRWAEREQGLLVAKGNPLGITALADVFHKRARVMLRPDGSGSRVLFDALVQRSQEDPSRLSVLAGEAQTEADLATAIADGEADCGIGIAAVTKRVALDFVPLGIREAFDLVMRRRDYFEPPVQKLLRFTHGEAFRKRLHPPGGYDLTTLGQVIFNG
jgi:excisionase family DNA binding protein